MQVALIVIMAQIGSFVPASFASVRMVDKLFTRIGTSDSIETNSSSFMVEMQETAHIVNHATDRCGALSCSFRQCDFETLCVTNQHALRSKGSCGRGIL